MNGEIDRLVAAIKTCRICRDKPSGRPLPHEPRPVVVPSATARVLVAGQAPGTRVHVSGRPFTDPSGERLRAWMGVSDEVFYDPGRISIVPMGFCFPGLDAKGSDLPPRRECAPVWRAALMAAMPQVELVLAVGGPAQKWHLGPMARNAVSDTVADWRAILAATGLPKVIPTPHPSWRNNHWLKKNPWFEGDLLPVLRAEVARLVA